MMRSTRLILGFVVVTAACSAGDGPTPPPPPPLSTAPLLLAPQMGDTIAQNDPTIGCPFDNAGGYGFAVHFDWSIVSGAAAYHLHLQHTGSPFAALDTILPDSTLTYRFCNAYVIDANLHDWRWTVAGVTDSGSDGPWAGEGTYEFAPMVFPPQP